MSYKNIILNDFPNSFYLLDEVQSGTIDDYTELLSQFATYQALLDSGLTYADINGTPVYDYSGNLNNGFASSASSKQLMPIISGGIRGTEITSLTEVYYEPKGIATKYYKDNSFSIEVWCALPSDNIVATIVGDPLINTGIFYENGNIVFKVGTNKVEHTVSNAQVVYVVGIFQNNLLSLYINGVLVDTNSLTSYQFSNELVNFKSGPSTGRLVIDSVAFYRYNLSGSQILNHYNEGIKEVNVSQIVSVDGGYLFSMNTESLRPKFTYSYPVSKLWSELESTNLYISDNQSYIYLPETELLDTETSSFTDSIVVPNYLNITTSQINWDDDVKGILVEVSKDDINWVACSNGKPLPYFNKNDNDIVDVLLIRVTLSSTDTSRYLPILRELQIKFYNSKDFYGDNSGYYVSSAYDYSLPNNNKRTLSYHKNNGLTMYDGHGFTINGIPSVRSVEVIFTPKYNQNVLVSGASEIYEWDTAGLITKTGISSIYVNGINRTSETNVWDFMSVDTPHHIVINFSSAATSIKFNQNQNDSKSGLGHMYNNVAVYVNELSVNSILNHYLLYTDNTINLISDTYFGVFESNLGDSSTPFFITVVEPEAVSL
jgi:hypothetical protein